jgi:hypothetical protein
MMSRQMTKNFPAVAGVILLGVLTGCASAPAQETSSGPGLESTGEAVGGEYYSVDGPQFDSVSALEKSSDAVVRGVFVAHSGDADEADLVADAPAGVTGLPLELWEFQVTETLQGEVPQTITVTQLARSVDAAVRTAEPGRESLLFLRSYGDGVYAVTGLGAGSFAVEGDKLAAPQGASSSLVRDVARLGDVESLVEVVEAVETGQ